MKNKKGFTLVELLAVIVILGTLMTLATLGVVKVMNDNKEKVGDFTLSQIKEAATTYALDNDYCQDGCTFTGKSNILNNLGAYYPEMEDKCDFSNDSQVNINWDGNEVLVNTVHIECRK